MELPLKWLLEHGRQLLMPDGQVAHASADLLPWQCSLLEAQSELRHRSRRRFPNPEDWLWTARSLAQASDWWCASAKAEMFPRDEALVDACCGAGVDAIASARRGPVVAVDRDESMVALALSNAKTQGLHLAVEACSFDLRAAMRLRARARLLHIDPDRRMPSEAPERCGGRAGTADQRTNRADAFSPSLDLILECARLFDATMVKLAPLTIMSADMEQQVNTTLSRAWMGRRGECRQQLLLAGDLRLVNPRQRLAILAEPTSGSTSVAKPEPSSACAGKPGGRIVYAAEPESGALEIADHPMRFVHDLHSVLHAANLQTAWSLEHDLLPLGSPHGYYTSDRALHSPWAQCFEVLAELPWDDRQVRKWLRGKEVGVVDVKNRLVRMDAAAFQRRYSADGPKPICLLVTKLGRRIRAIAARRCLSDTA